MLSTEGQIPVRRESSSSIEERKKREKAGKLATKLILFWVVLLVAIVVAVKFKSHPQQTKDVPDTRVTRNLVSEDAGFIQDAYPQFASTLGGFLNAKTPEAKNQFVHDPVDIVGAIDRFYRSNPMADIDLRSLHYAGGQVLRCNGRKAISTRWKTDTETIDAVFYREKGEWRLDWKQFVRYSQVPWPVFLAENGEDTSEFRLLARLRTTTSGDDLQQEASNVPKLRLILYNPKFGHPGEMGEPSPEFEVDAESTMGRRLKAAFESKKDEATFGNLANLDPEGMIRVRVRVSRTQEAGVRKFELVDLISTHWLSDNFPNIDEN
ncbi:hypothetical protein JIN85_08035 [Luteolibacter pohnpeiensis]|uniref:Uncharacterized protein n=2 Tax=Luteolibacter pohnpeiensis TaxID=454153 RepID=A0A934S704_9BACT|nr:hypothetical protein [Luteolibacter pohnpeiensis]